MSIFHKNKEQEHHLPAVIPGQSNTNTPAFGFSSDIATNPNTKKISNEVAENGAWVLDLIPEWIQKFLLDILKKALKRDGGSCLVLYVKHSENKKKKIEDQVRVITLKNDPSVYIPDLEKKLANDYQELLRLQKRNRFLEAEYQKYLNNLRNGTHSGH